MHLTSSAINLITAAAPFPGIFWDVRGTERPRHRHFQGLCFTYHFKNVGRNVQLWSMFMNNHKGELSVASKAELLYNKS